MEDSWVQQAASVLNCSVGKFPFIYLGLPIGVNARKKSTWQPVIDKIRSRLTVWRLKIENNCLWVNVLKEKYGVTGNVVSSGGKVYLGWWRELLKLECEDSGYKNKWFSSAVSKVLGDGQNTLFWKDPWLEGGPLEVRFARLFSLSLDRSGKVSNLVSWQDGECVWRWQWRRRLFQWEKEELCLL